MKKLYIMALISLSFIAAQAQQFTGTNNTTAPISRTGNLGLGTFTSPSNYTSPTARLHINKIAASTTDDILLSKGDWSAQWGLNLNYTTNALEFRNSTGVFAGSTFPLTLNANLIRSTVNLQVDTKLAIGTTSFTQPFQVGNLFQVNTTGAVFASGLKASASNYDRFSIEANDGTVLGPAIELKKPMGTGDGFGDITIISRYNVSNNNGSGDIRFMAWDGAADYKTKMLIKANGKVSIGSENTPAKANANGGQYMLFVQGGILTQEMSVKLTEGSFPDYVFADDYKLMPLKVVESFIKENKHLPNMPSGKEVEANDMNLKEIMLKQQEKIEELYLHIIALEKMIKSESKVDIESSNPDNQQNK